MRFFEDWVVVFMREGVEQRTPRMTKLVAFQYLDLIPEATCIEKVRGLWKRRIKREKPSSLLASPSIKGEAASHEEG